MFVSLSLPHQVVRGAFSIEAMIEEIYGTMGPFVVPTTVNMKYYVPILLNPPTHPPLNYDWNDRLLTIGSYFYAIDPST